MNHRTLAALALLAGCLAAALAVGVLPGPAGASHGYDEVDVTVHPGSHDTGAGDVSYELTAEWKADTIDSAPKFSNPDSIVVQFGGANVTGCEAGPLQSANYEIGVNQSTESGYQYQSYIVDSATWDGNAVEFAFADSDDGNQPDYGQDDVLEFTLDSCVANADEDDWYIAAIQVEGRSPTDRTVNFTEASHYYGICDGCESDDDARDAMGNPPSEPDPTPTPTPTETQTPTPTANPYPTAGPTDTPTDTPEPTVTSTPTTTAANATRGTDGPGDRDPVDAEVFGMNPLAVVAIVAIVSIGLAALGARRL